MYPRDSIFRLGVADLPRVQCIVDQGRIRAANERATETCQDETGKEAERIGRSEQPEQAHGSYGDASNQAGPPAEPIGERSRRDLEHHPGHALDAEGEVDRLDGEALGKEVELENSRMKGEVTAGLVAEEPYCQAQCGHGFSQSMIVALGSR